MNLLWKKGARVSLDFDVLGLESGEMPNLQVGTLWIPRIARRAFKRLFLDNSQSSSEAARARRAAILTHILNGAKFGRQDAKRWNCAAAYDY